MILEVASMQVRAGQEQAFEAAYDKARHVVARAAGFISIEMQRSVDQQGHYLIFIGWHTRDDHMVGFRESPLFGEWRALLQPSFAAAPVVEHYERVALKE